jgi:hypothetical protein
VLLTETINEYDDKYYSFNFPAYWNYKNMSQSSKNIDFECQISKVSGTNSYKLNGISKPYLYLTNGDEVWIKQKNQTFDEDGLVPNFKAWVVEVGTANFELIDKYGVLVSENYIGLNPSGPSGDNIAKLKVVKSGYDNQQADAMASVTSITNPIKIGGVQILNLNQGGILYQQNNWNTYKIINASAVEYEDFWASQCECFLPQTKMNGDQPIFEYQVPLGSEDSEIAKRLKSFNPYLYNIKGNWRAKKSYAYLAGRIQATNPTPRVSGFFNHFYPFYVYDGTKWKKETITDNIDRWTFASEISKYSPYGNEIENRDALKRYSSSIYGYNLKNPIAVASNAAYNEIAFDGFEDYPNYAIKDSTKSICKDKAHFNFKLNDDAKLNKQHVHTGKYSIRVAPKGKVSAERKISNCNN